MPERPKLVQRTKPAETRREELMNSALALFLEHGVPATTIEQITTGAKVAKGTFYLHFKSKDEILAALRDRYMQEFVASIDVRVAGCTENDWKGKLRAWADGAVTATVDTLNIHDVVFHDYLAAPPREPQDSATIAQEHLARLLEQGHLAGAWRVEDASFTAVFLFNGLHAALEGALKEEQSFNAASFLMKVEKLFYRSVALLPE